MAKNGRVDFRDPHPYPNHGVWSYVTRLEDLVCGAGRRQHSLAAAYLCSKIYTVYMTVFIRCCNMLAAVSG